MRISDVLADKGSSVLTVRPDSTVTELVAALAEHRVGAAVVVDNAERSSIAGMVSERDVVRCLHQRGAEVLASPVSEIMTTTVTTCRGSDMIESLTVIMTEKRIRHLPVVDDSGALRGIVSIGDVVKSHIEALEEHREQLESYIVQG